MRRQDNGAGAGFFLLIGLVLSMIWLIQALILRARQRFRDFWG
jgi:hypothetical protein